MNSGIKNALRNLGIKASNKGTSTGVKWIQTRGEVLTSVSPVDGKKIATVDATDKQTFDSVLKKSVAAFREWRMWPAPKRGEVIRHVGIALREKKAELGLLVSYEMGKSLQEGLGEVQEMIDICDFAVGLSRQIGGVTMPSERVSHRMYEQYHPLGVVGIITAFNFPVAVWSWNTMLAWVCGDTCIWKPSEKTPLCAVACQKIVASVFQQHNVPEGVSVLVNGDYKAGQWLASDHRVSLVSATGSVRMGKVVAQTVAARLGKTLLELGGNNAIIITPNADLDLAIRGALFGAIGTAGQRCTSTRRLIVHRDVLDEVKQRLATAYKGIRVGNPLDESNHVGPLIDRGAVKLYQSALSRIKKEGGNFIVPGGVYSGKGYESGCYVKPVVAEMKKTAAILQEETFGPILYLIPYKSFEEAIEIQNGVTQGLSSAIMTTRIDEMERFLSAEGSDCGIANVNIGTSGAEIGGAFGGEKDSGGGRESGSDAWKVYMRRQTNTINYGNELPLAQGIKFDV